MTVIVPVQLGERSYQIHIGQGLFGRARSADIRKLVEVLAQSLLPIVTDENRCGGLHYDRLGREPEGSGT